MAERRTLVEGITQPPKLDPEVERAFIAQARPASSREAKPEAATARRETPTSSRSPLSTRIRSDFAAALKRASLERQLEQVEPNTISDILEAALEPWLKANGYLS